MSSRISIVAVTLACAWLVAMSACESGCRCTQSSRGYQRRQYWRALVDELCAPRTYFIECVFHEQESCYQELPANAAYCIKKPEQRPGETYRQAVLRCLVDIYAFVTAGPWGDRDECLDPTPWEHVPPTGAEILESTRRYWNQFKTSRVAPDTDGPDTDGPNTDGPNTDGPLNIWEKPNTSPVLRDR